MTLAVENERLWELLRRWVRSAREALSPPELARLVDATKRALFRLGPGWADEDD